MHFYLNENIIHADAKLKIRDNCSFFYFFYDTSGVILFSMKLSECEDYVNPYQTLCCTL